MLDPVTNVPITGSEAVKVLGDTETLTAFETAGIQASPFTAAGTICYLNPALSFIIFLL